jgi:hypothetical protein
MPSFTEDTLAAVLDALNRGDPLRRVAYDYGILRTTLQHRRDGQ